MTWSGLAEATADGVIAATIDRFARLGAGEWEWKHYSYDPPGDLPRRLLAAGFTAEPAEALMVGEIAELAQDVPPPPGVELRPVTDRQGVDALVRVTTRCSARITRLSAGSWSPGSRAVHRPLPP